MKKKFLGLLLVASIAVMSVVGCFASSGEQGFVDALTDPSTGINADTMWGSITPVAKIIIACFLFAFVFGIIKKVLKKNSRGKFGM